MAVGTCNGALTHGVGGNGGPGGFGSWAELGEDATGARLESRRPHLPNAASRRPPTRHGAGVRSERPSQTRTTSRAACLTPQSGDLRHAGAAPQAARASATAPRAVLISFVSTGPFVHGVRGACASPGSRCRHAPWPQARAPTHALPCSGSRKSVDSPGAMRHSVFLGREEGGGGGGNAAGTKGRRARTAMPGGGYGGPRGAAAAAALGSLGAALNPAPPGGGVWSSHAGRAC